MTKDPAASKAWLVVVIGLGISGVSAAYEPVTHGIFSDQAVQQSSLGDADAGILKTLGLGSSVDDKAFLLPSTFPFRLTLTPMRLIRFGVEQEDEGNRPLNHFYDPQNGGRPLTYNALDLIGIPLGKASPHWALEDGEEIEEQWFSYKDTQETLRRALKSPTKTERDRYLGLTFEGLGHVIHHLQDMAQPQHVRNDAHCDKLFSLCLVGEYRPSAYEAYTRQKSAGLALTMARSVDYGTFALPRQFWVNEGKGIAEFTSRNFVTVRTNFSNWHDEFTADPDYVLPGAANIVIEKRDITELLGPVGAEQPLSGEIWFVGTPVKDAYVFSETLNARTATFSIFDRDLESAGPWKTMSLNRFNYEAAHAFLLSRAVGYSTGLLNYFFRGRIEIGLPDDGVFSVIDHAVTNAAGQGFEKLKVKLRNATAPGVRPDGTSVQQEMPAGKLTAIAKYIVNPCYQPDLLGEYDGGPIDFVSAITRNGCTLEDYFGGIEEIAVSAELTGQSLGREEAQEVTFDFSQQPIPIDAHDLSLQIVYEGVLGSEQDAIVVSGRNLSEPTYISLINGSDYFGIDGELYTPEEIRARADLRSRIGAVNIDPEPLVNVTMSVAGMPIAGVGTLPAKGHHRIAVLTDAEFQAPEDGPAPIQVEIRSRFSSGPLGITTLVGPPIRNQLARAPATLTGISIERRGITSWMSLYRFKQLAGSVITAEKIDALPPMDPTCFDGANWSCVPSPAPIDVASQ